MNDVARVSRILLKIEAEFPVNELVYKEVCAWPLIRGHIAAELLQGRRLPYSEEYAVPPQEKRAKVHAWARSCVSALVTDLPEIVFMTVGFEYTRLDDCWYNKFFDPLKDLIHACGMTCLDMETGFPGGPFEPKCHPVVSAAELLDSAVHLREVPGSIALFDDFAAFLAQHDIMHDPGHERFVCRLETMLAEAVIFRMILEKAQPRTAFLVCYYHDRAMAFLKACHDLGIPCIEVQHSIIEPQCMHYSNWTCVPSGGYELMPDAFWTWGETAAATLRAWFGDSPEHPRVFVGGNLWLAKNQHIPRPAELAASVAANQRTILFTLAGVPFEPVADLVPAALLEAMDLAPPDWKWIVRLHYKMDDRIRGQLEELFAPWRDRVEIQPASQWPLYDLFKVSDYHVCILSTTQLEAEAFGVPNIVIGSMGGEHHRREIADGIYLFARDGRELCSFVANRTQPLRRPSPLMLTDTAVAGRVLTQIGEVDTAMKVRREMQAQNKDGYAPQVFTIETTLACNLRCPECAIGGGMISRNKGLMSFEQYKIIADKIRPYARYVYLHIWGEPLLNPDIFRMIAYTAAFARTNISTNGMALTREMAEALITSGVAEVIVSIDGVSQEVYEQYRVGGDVQQAFAALAALVEANRRHGGQVAISPQFVVFRHNQHEMEAFSRRCAALGLQASFKAPYLRPGSRFAAGDYPEFQRPHYDDVTQLRAAMRECQNPREVFTVLADGSVVICCHDYAGVTCFGNIFRQEVMDVWNATEYVDFRRAILEGRAPDFCVSNCMTWVLGNKDDKALERDVEPQAAQAAVRLNLCSGAVRLPGFVNIDVLPGADLQIDLEHELLPFADGSVECVVCISAINYFTYRRAGQIIADVFRVLKPGGVARFATQDLRLLARYYLSEADNFFAAQLADGQDRFPGRTRADKFNEFFYGFRSGDKHCNYVYDFESLAMLFRDAGFALIEELPFGKSRINGAELFDNRPEQMFFLEAVKPGAERPACRTEEKLQGLLALKSDWLGQAGQPLRSATDEVVRQLASDPERGWQRLLQLLETNPADLAAVQACAAVLKECGRFGDLVKLYARYLSVYPDDGPIRTALADAQQAEEAENVRRGQRDRQSRSALQATYDERLNRIGSDREHLDACMAWLCRAQDQNGRGGVSALYYMGQSRWDIDYPETTGYIIPTFLSYAQLTGKAEFFERARRMGEWELAIQATNGGAGEPYGLYGYMPRIFNTGQVMLGWLALYKETGSSAYLEALVRAGDWIAGCLDHEGKWSAHTYQGPKAYKSRVSWSLLELYALTGETRYRQAAERSVAWMLRQAEPTGWFRNCSLTDPDHPWTHLIGYVLVGLQEVVRLNTADIDTDRVAWLLQQAGQGISTTYRQMKQAACGRFVTLPGALNPQWQGSDAWTCVTGTAQLEFFLRRLGWLCKDPVFIETADMMLADIKQLQYLDGVSDPNIYGGLPGSYPLGGEYCSYAIPNWGVKFFSDCLLQRLVGNTAGLPYVG